MSIVLDIRNLRTEFPNASGPIRVVDGVSFSLSRGEVLALVGESGSGKSMTALSILRLVPKPGRVSSGEVNLNGQNLLGLPVTEMRRVRGGQIAMIFQEPMTCLNPVVTVGTQVIEAIQLHESIGTVDARAVVPTAARVAATVRVDADREAGLFVDDGRAGIAAGRVDLVGDRIADGRWFARPGMGFGHRVPRQRDRC